MTIPPSAPPVLAEEPAETLDGAAFHTLLSRYEVALQQECGLYPGGILASGVHAPNPDRKAAASRSMALAGDVRAAYAALLAQARQGREDAERLRADAERWRYIRDRRAEVERAFTSHGYWEWRIVSNGYVEGADIDIDDAIDLAIAATPSPSPEGA